MSNKASVPTIPFMRGVTHSIKEWVKDSSKENGRWLLIYLLCVFTGLLGVHNLFAKRIGRFFLFLFTAGLLGFGVMIDILTLLNNGFLDNKKERVTSNYPFFIKLVLFSLYIAVIQLAIVLVLHFLKLDLSTIESFFTDFNLQKVIGLLQMIVDSLRPN